MGPPVEAVSDPVDYDEAKEAAAASAAMYNDLENPSKHKFKRTEDVNAPCGPQPDGYGPKPDVDTVEDFLAYGLFHVGSIFLDC